MAVEVKARWSPNWRITDRIKNKRFKGPVEPGFYSSPIEIPPKDAFLQHSVNGKRNEPTFPTIRAAIEKAA